MIANIVAQGTLLGLFGAVVACGVAAARQPDRGGEAWRALVSCAVAVSAAVGVMVVAPPVWLILCGSSTLSWKSWA